jgi:DNA polymerase III sliding clamp (beta) subunit (PCNA family)
VAVNQLIPLLTHYWFTGTHVMGYNGQIALQIPFRTDFRGAVPGKVLELLQRASFEKDIKVTPQGGNISITDAAGDRIRIKLGMLEPNFIFAMPKRKRMRSDPQAIAELIEAIEQCLISVGSDTLNVEHLGITLEPERGQIILYSTDGGTIARASISDRLRLAQRTILPTAFCEQMKHLYRERLDDKAQVHFEVGKRHALFIAGEATLYTRLLRLRTRRPLNLSGTVAYHLPRAFQQQLVDIPPRLRKALELHSLVCDESRRLMSLSVRGETLRLRSQNDGEEIDESMPLPGHPDVAVRVEPRLLRRALGFEQMLVARECVALSKASGGLYLISAGEPRDEPAGEMAAGEDRRID